MQYFETLPDDVFSHHIECYWQMALQSNCEHSPYKLLLPTCTFNIIFVEQECKIKTSVEDNWIDLPAGAAFFGQRNSCIEIRSNGPLRFSGVRFKPFAFANIIQTPIFLLNDVYKPLDTLFDMTPSVNKLIQEILITQEVDLKFPLINELMYSLFKHSLSIDETLRAQLNYIMDRKGSVKVSELFQEFNISKVTLRKHFIKKVGLTPKKVSQIWRMNHMFQLKEDHPDEKMTGLCLKAGFYDQAHFIKDFQSLFRMSPRKYFHQNDQLLKVAHINISKRFTNQYDPR